MNTTITSVPGVEVGHWTSNEHATGVTVVTFPEPNVATVEVRGAAPGSRETALLEPGMRVEQIQALVFSGGSAFGLATADGVTRELAADGRGHPTPYGVVPIVPAAIIYDLVPDSDFRPGSEQGAAAYLSPLNRTGHPGQDWSRPGGDHITMAGARGSAPVRPRVGCSHLGRGHGGSVGDRQRGGRRVHTRRGIAHGRGSDTRKAGACHPPHTQTTLIALATDARLERTNLLRLAIRAQDAIAACVRPSHTRYDGDAAFAVSCGDLDGDPDALGEAAFVATGRAIEAAVRSV